MNIYILNPHNKNGGIIMCCLEENIIRQCSPTLAGLKMANLFNYGYEKEEILNQEISKIEGKLNSKGVFLGYPIDDVKAFICNKGKKCLLCGVWKVYCNVAESQKIFDRYRKCTDIYLKMFAEKKNIMQLTVSV